MPQPPYHSSEDCSSGQRLRDQLQCAMPQLRPSRQPSSEAPVEAASAEIAPQANKELFSSFSMSSGQAHQSSISSGVRPKGIDTSDTASKAVVRPSCHANRKIRAARILPGKGARIAAAAAAPGQADSFQMASRKHPAAMSGRQSQPLAQPLKEAPAAARLQGGDHLLTSPTFVNHQPPDSEAAFQAALQDPPGSPPPARARRKGPKP